jgi:uncharacterized membrane protein
MTLDFENMSLRWTIVIALSTVLVVVFAQNDVASPLRPIAALWFLLICPGMAFIQLLNFNDHLYEIVLAIALSLALDLIIASIILYTQQWSPDLILLILVSLTSFGVLCHLIQWWRLQAQETD